MVERTELWVNRKDLRATKIVNDTTPQLAEGEVLVAIDKFALTANNVSYAVTGDIIGYWQFYPAEGDWGKVPVWGCADVVESNCAELPAGERIYGFFPMSSHAVLRPGNITAEQFMDFAAHRKALPSLYNAYRRTRAEPKAVQDFENERCLLFPLFATSFLIYDYLQYNALFGASQILIGSVSSKTGFGLAKMLFDDPSIGATVIGITSAANREFVQSLGCCHATMVYGEEEQINAQLPTAYIDMSGDGRLTAALHHHLGDQMRASIMVGATHWDQQHKQEELPGAKPEFFFAPSHVQVREKEWGQGVPMTKAMAASMQVADAIVQIMQVEWLHGAPALQANWVAMLDNKVPASRGLMVALAEQDS